MLASGGASRAERYSRNGESRLGMGQRGGGRREGAIAPRQHAPETGGAANKARLTPRL